MILNTKSIDCDCELSKDKMIKLLEIFEIRSIEKLNILVGAYKKFRPVPYLF